MVWAWWESRDAHKVYMAIQVNPARNLSPESRVEPETCLHALASDSGQPGAWAPTLPHALPGCEGKPPTPRTKDRSELPRGAPSLSCKQSSPGLCRTPLKIAGVICVLRATFCRGKSGDSQTPTHCSPEVFPPCPILTLLRPQGWEDMRAVHGIPEEETTPCSQLTKD